MKQRLSRSVGLLSACALLLGALVPGTSAYAKDAEGNQPTVDITYTLHIVDDQTVFPNQVTFGEAEYVPTKTPVGYVGGENDASLIGVINTVNLPEGVDNEEFGVASSISFPSGDFVEGDYEWKIDLSEYVDLGLGFTAFSSASDFLVSASYTKSGGWANIKITKNSYDGTTSEEVTRIEASGLVLQGSKLVIHPPASAKEGETFNVHFAAEMAPAIKALKDEEHTMAGITPLGVRFMLMLPLFRGTEKCVPGTASLGGIPFPQRGENEGDEAFLLRAFHELFGDDFVLDEENDEIDLPTRLYDMAFECDITVGAPDTKGLVVADWESENDIATMFGALFGAGAKFSVTPIVPEDSPYGIRVESHSQSSIHGEISNPTGVDQVMANGRNVIQLVYVAPVSISFDGNAEDVSGSTATLKDKRVGSKVTMPANGFKRSGYKFTGWNTEEYGTGTTYAEGAEFVVPDSSTILFAQWKKVPSVKPTPTGTPSGQPSTPSVKPTSPVPSVSPQPGGSCDVSGGSQEVYRLYNPVTSEHLFTTDKKEYEALAAKHGWKQEGTAWVSPDATASSVGVYRLYNPGLGDHHYTKDQDEAAALVSKFGWVYDNDAKPLFYSDDSCQRVPVYRQYNGGLTSGQHHYTADENEAKALITKHGWKNEAIGWYAISQK